jgi:hypothetical protein
LASFQQLHHDVQRILGLEDLVQLHAVFLVEGPHDFDFLDETLLALVLTVSSFLGKGLDGKAAADFQLLSQVHRREVALPDFLLGLELFVEASLIDPPLQDLSAGSEVALTAQAVVGSFFLLFEVEGERGSGEGVLDVEVEQHRLLLSVGDLEQAAFVELQGCVAFRGVQHVQAV